MPWGQVLPVARRRVGGYRKLGNFRAIANWAAGDLRPQADLPDPAAHSF